MQACTPEKPLKCLRVLHSLYMGLVIRRKIVIFILIWLGLFIGQSFLCKRITQQF